MASAERAQPAGASQGRVPDFFIVGHHKSGTTAMYEMLRRHPDIYMPEQKSPRFFATDLHPREGVPIPRTMPRTFEEYLALFAPAGPQQRVGEATESYLMSHTAAGAIAAVQPAAKIIAILREPASFLRSLHFQYVQFQVEDETDLRTALSLEQERREGRHIPPNAYWPKMLLYSEHARYLEQLRRFEAVFPPEQVLVLIYDDFRKDNEAVLRRVLGFLEVDDSAPLEVMEVNPTVRVRSTRVDGMVRSLSAGRGPVARTAKAAVKTLTPRRLRSEALKTVRQRVVYAKPRPADDELMDELRRRFRPDVVELSEYLNRDLVTLWGYDSVD